MEVTREKNGKIEKLWHVQNTNICDGPEPYDLFVWSEEEPDEELLRKAFIEDGDYDADDPLVKEFTTSSECYHVWASGEEE